MPTPYLCSFDPSVLKNDQKQSIEPPLESPRSFYDRAISVPLFQEIDTPSKHQLHSRFQLMRSSSDADIGDETIETKRNSLKRRSQSIDDIVLSGGEDENEASLETASRKIEEALGDRKMTKLGSRPFLSLLTNRKKPLKKKKNRDRSCSQGEEESQSGSTTPVDCQSTENSPSVSRKANFFKKARNSLLLFNHQDVMEVEGFVEGRSSTEGSGSISSCEHRSTSPPDSTHTSTTSMYDKRNR